MPTICTVLDAGGISEGDAVCLVDFDAGNSRPKVARATAANLLTSKTVLGVAREAKADTEAISINVAGEVTEADIDTGLLAGAAVGTSRIIATDINAADAATQSRLLRVLRPDGSECVVGTCDEKGNLAVQPRASRDTSAPHVYNPKDYGCPWDGVHDDLPGWQAMIAAIPFTDSVPVVIQLPPGQAYFSDFLEISHALIIRGQGGRILDAVGELMTNNGLRFAPLKGIILHNFHTSPDRPNTEGADGTIIEHCSIKSTVVIVAEPVFGNGRALKTLDTSLDIREHHKFYEKGTCVIAFGSTGTGAQTQESGYLNEGATRGGTKFMFRVTTAGVTADVVGDPTEFITATVSAIGTSITDGGVTWTVESIPKDYMNGQVYEVGERVFLPGDTGSYFECVVRGTSLEAGTLNYGHVGIGVRCPPEMNSPTFGQAFADDPTKPDELKWRAHFPTGVMNLATACAVRSCSIAGFTGYAVYSLSNLDPETYEVPNGSGLFGEFSDLIVSMCGGGLRWHGVDVGGSQSHSVQFYFLGSGRTNVDAAEYLNTGGDVWGTGAASILDRSLVLNRHVNCYSQFSSGIPFRNDHLEPNSGNQSRWDLCLAETPYACRFVGAPLVTGCAPIAPTGGGIIIDSASGRGLAETDAVGTKQLRVGLTRQTGKTAFWMTSLVDEDPANQYLGWEYEQDAQDGPIGTGWWGFEYGSQNRQIGFGMSSAKATEGPGHLRIYNGHFAGTENSGSYYQGLDQLALRSPFVNGGHQLVGYRFKVKSSGVPGTWDEWVVKTEGYRGFPWSAFAGQALNVGDPYFYEPWGMFANIIEPNVNEYPIPAAGRKVFRAIASTGDGQAAPVEPDWETHFPDPEDLGATWTDASTGTGTVTYKYLGKVPEYVRASFVDDPMIAFTPQALQSWSDTPATDPTTRAPTCSMRRRRYSATTSATTAEQALASFALNDETTNVIEVTVFGKLPSSTSGITCKLTGSFTRSGGTVTRLGSDDVSPPKETGSLAGSTFDLNLNDTSLEIRVTPGTASATDWGIVVECEEVKNS